MSSVVFDESNSNSSGNPRLDLMFLQSIQNQANDQLQLQGFITLNEVYRLLGFEQTEEGALVGWTKGGWVDFGGPFDEGTSITLTFNTNSDNVFQKK